MLLNPSRWRRVWLIVVASALGGMITAPRAAAQTKRPKLVIALVLDQFPAEYLSRWERHFGPGGFRRLMRGGAYLRNAQYGHATTSTGPGHALILSGTYGHISGIIGNRWLNRKTGQVESMFFDPDAQLLGGVEALPRDDDTSPRAFLGDNMADRLRIWSGMRSKAVGVSLKDRAAIMLAGKLGRAYWFHEKAGGFLSSTYYRKDLPEWVRAFNARRLPDAYLGARWDRILPENAYDTADDFPHERDLYGLGRTFPHTLTGASGKPTPEFYEAFTATPFSTDYLMRFARLAIEQEGLGDDEWPDLLGVSITATDIAGHTFGPNSREMQDLVVRTDRQIAEFLAYLDNRFQPGQWLLVLTSDHGVCPIPEYLAALGMDARRIRKSQISAAVETALGARFGAAKWLLALEEPALFLDPAVIAEKKLDPAAVERAAGEAARTVPGIAAFFTRAQIQSGQLPPGHWAPYFEKAFFPARSGDVLLMTQPFYFWGSYGDRDEGTMHGSPYSYDTHVPLVFYGPGLGVRPGAYDFRADISDIAPTLAAVLGISPPAGCEGRPLHEILSR